MSELKDIGITTRKEDDFSEWYTQVVTKAGLIDYSPVKGFIVLNHMDIEFGKLSRNHWIKN